MTQLGEWEGRQSIQRNDEGTNGDVLRMRIDADKVSDRLVKKDGERRDHHGIDNEGSRERIVHVFFIFLFLDEPEVGRFKTKQYQYVQKGDDCKNQVHLAIIGGVPEFICEIRGQQVVQEPGEDGACAIPDGLSRQFLYAAQYLGLIDKNRIHPLILCKGN